ncbi:hypothetical protein [Methermicoccus shengliensis]|uniref:Uncharacterized protein n=1 Tax=Methermicoccus shengliensis TaxID=660064 RepID=A0A832VZ66_9EURY|nr:hypothetical protein [Methermicoccus shengliensis]HIH69020.1 hypothetical protein [Methermicoccus shengliensis]
MLVLVLTAIVLSLPMPPTFWMVALGYVVLSTVSPWRCCSHSQSKSELASG